MHAMGFQTIASFSGGDYTCSGVCVLVERGQGAVCRYVM